MADKRSVEYWIARNEYMTNRYWREILKPALGRSVKKMNAVMPRLKDGVQVDRLRGYPLLHRAVGRIDRRLQGYETVAGASWVHGQLFRLTRARKDKILRQRRKNRTP